MTEQFTYTLDEFKFGELRLSGNAVAVFDEEEGTAKLDHIEELRILFPDEDEFRPAIESEIKQYLEVLNNEPGLIADLEQIARELCNDAGGDFGGDKEYMREIEFQWYNR